MLLTGLLSDICKTLVFFVCLFVFGGFFLQNISMFNITCAFVCFIGAGSVHLQSKGHVSTQSASETLLLSSHHHLPVTCPVKRAGQTSMHTHTHTHIIYIYGTHCCVIILTLSVLWGRKPGICNYNCSIIKIL